MVFNASHRSLTGISLNETLHSGPPLQSNLVEVILRWRFHRVGFVADVEKMFRQIKVRQEDTDMQRIIWKRPTDLTETVFRLTTVTYGTRCASFLAMRTLRQLAEDEGCRYPEAAGILKDAIYVDDVLSGADDEDTAARLIGQLTALMGSGGFRLKKWATNNPRLLEAIPVEDRLRRAWRDLAEESVHMLGLRWDPEHDVFSFSLPNSESFDFEGATKRRILSITARLYDPAGWLFPITIAAKVILQDLWLAKIS